MEAILQHHMGGSTYWIYSNMLLQLRVPGRFLGHVFVLDFALFTLAITLSAWISGIILDDTSLYPRQLSFLLAIGSLLPLLPWVWLNRSNPQRLPAGSGNPTD
jgi:hypothetical protein